MGLNGVDNGRLWFDGVRVPRDNLLNRFADVTDDGRYESAIENPDRRFFTMLGTLVQGRVCVGGAGINAAKVALAIATKYAVRRRQFEAARPTEEELLLDYGMHQRRLLPLLARTYALHFAQEVVSRASCTTSSPATAATTTSTRAASWSRGPPAPRRSAPGTRPAPSRSAARLCGGAGYLAVNRFAALQGRHRRVHDLRGRQPRPAAARREGPAHRLLQRLRGPRPVRHGAVRRRPRVETVIERTAAHKLLERIKDVLPGGDDGWDQEAGLLDPEYQLAMLRFREEHMLAGVARRLKRGIDERPEPGRGLLPCPGPRDRRGPRPRRAARARGVRRQDRGRMPAGDHKVALGLLCDLHALTTIEADRAWFMEHGRLSSARSKAITREVGDLCRRIRPLAVDLVDAFGVPAEMLRAPDLLG